MSREKTLLKNSAFIFIGKMATVLANILLLPLYTSIFSRSEYGTVDLITTIVSLALPVITLYVEQGMFRYMIEEINEDQKAVYSASAFKFIIILTLVYIVVYLFIMSFIDFKYTYYIAAIIFTHAVSNWLLQYLRGMRKLAVFSLISFLSSFTAICLNIFFLVVLKTGIEGIFISSAIAPFVIFLSFFIKNRIYTTIMKYKMDMKKIKEMLAYSIALIPNSLSIWVLNSSDRFIVVRLLGLDFNGILSVSHKFVSYYGYFNSTFLTSWQETGTVHYKDADRDEFFSGMLLKTFEIFAAFSIMVIAVIPIVFDILINANYRSAYNTIPIYIIAELCNTIIGFLGVIYIANKNTIVISISTAVIAIINIVVHLTLVNSIGLYAAAISTAFSYFCVLIFRIIDTKKYIRLRYSIKHVLFYLGFLGIVILTYYLKNYILSVFVFISSALVLLTINKVYARGILNYVKKRINH